MIVLNTGTTSLWLRKDTMLGRVEAVGDPEYEPYTDVCGMVRCPDTPEGMVEAENEAVATLLKGLETERRDEVETLVRRNMDAFSR